MNEEMMTNVEEEIVDYVENYSEPVVSGKGVLTKVLIGVAIVGAGAAAFLYKSKDKLEQRRIRKLEAKGYVITKPEPKDKEVSNEDDAE